MRVTHTVKELDFLVHLLLGLLGDFMNDRLHCYSLLLRSAHTLRLLKFLKVSHAAV